MDKFPCETVTLKVLSGYPLLKEEKRKRERKIMGKIKEEVITRTATEYTAKVKRYNYDTDTLEEYTVKVRSFSENLTPADIAERLNVPTVKALKSLKKKTVKVIITLENAFKYGTLESDGLSEVMIEEKKPTENKPE